MTAFESTRRDLAMIKDLAWVPMNWSAVTAGDTVLSGKDGMSWHVVSIEKMATHAVVRLVQGKRQAVAEVDQADAVHVLEDSTGWRRAEFEGSAPVRSRKKKTS
jgi:hypothetical protein